LATAHNLGTELSTTHFDQLLSMWWKPQYQTWFLYDLIVFNVVYLAVRAVDRRLVLAVAVALFAASSWFGDVEMSSLVGKGIRHFGRFFLFYWLGIVLARWVLARHVEQVHHRDDSVLLWNRPPDATYGCVPPPGLCSTGPTHGGSADEDTGSGGAPLVLERPVIALGWSGVCPLRTLSSNRCALAGG
jgi:hypothetical protein